MSERTNWRLWSSTGPNDFGDVRQKFQHAVRLLGKVLTQAYQYNGRTRLVDVIVVRGIEAQKKLKRTAVLLLAMAMALVALCAATPSNGVQIAGVTIVGTNTAEAYQVGVDTRNKRVWMKTSSFEVLRYGGTALAARACANLAAIPYVGVPSAAACIGGAAQLMNTLANRYRSVNKGIWVEIGRCSSGANGVCGGTF